MSHADKNDVLKGIWEAGERQMLATDINQMIPDASDAWIHAVEHENRKSRHAAVFPVKSATIRKANTCPNLLDDRESRAKTGVKYRAKTGAITRKSSTSSIDTIDSIAAPSRNNAFVTNVMCQNSSRPVTTVSIVKPSKKTKKQRPSTANYHFLRKALTLGGSDSRLNENTLNDTLYITDPHEEDEEDNVKDLPVKYDNYVKNISRPETAPDHLLYQKYARTTPLPQSVPQTPAIPNHVLVPLDETSPGTRLEFPTPQPNRDKQNSAKTKLTVLSYMKPAGNNSVSLFNKDNRPSLLELHKEVLANGRFERKVDEFTARISPLKAGENCITDYYVSR